MKRSRPPKGLWPPLTQRELEIVELDLEIRRIEKRRRWQRKQMSLLDRFAESLGLGKQA